KLLELLDSPAVIMTLGGRGMALFEEAREPVFIPPTNFTEVYDVTGAGDTVVSALTLSLISGGSFLEGALIASHAAGVVVRKAGVAVCSGEELMKSLASGRPD
ncbi:MAG: PfkB family carbohydrate kinase, partial [Halanaerobium sp.]|nr:PfkB family carbohydrate kinase [Halanaerobium sp.]